MDGIVNMLTDQQWIDSAAKAQDFQRSFVDALDERRTTPSDDLLSALLDGRDDIATFVEETQRLKSTVQGLFRVVTQDMQSGGYAVPKDARVMLRYAVANRDGAKFAAPNRLDVCRGSAGAHLAFGAGIRHWLGAQLARYEMIAALEAILAPINNLAYAPDRNSFQHHLHLCLCGLK